MPCHFFGAPPSGTTRLLPFTAGRASAALAGAGLRVEGTGGSRTAGRATSVCSGGSVFGSASSSGKSFTCLVPGRMGACFMPVATGGGLEVATPGEVGSGSGRRATAERAGGVSSESGKRATAGRGAVTSGSGKRVSTERTMGARSGSAARPSAGRGADERDVDDAGALGTGEREGARRAGGGSSGGKIGGARW